jgi:hypothetical protein
MTKHRVSISARQGAGPAFEARVFEILERLDRDHHFRENNWGADLMWLLQELVDLEQLMRLQNLMPLIHQIKNALYVLMLQKKVVCKRLGGKDRFRLPALVMTVPSSTEGFH